MNKSASLGSCNLNGSWQPRRGSIFSAFFVFLIIATLPGPLWADVRSPRNVILFIGDGMGPEHIRAARLYHGQALSFESFPYAGKMTTRSANNAVTDSAASATAMSTGFKVDNGVISRSTPGDGSDLETLVEYFTALNKRTGLVTTAYLTHATPAAFGAHAANRLDIDAIAYDYLYHTRPYVMLGGGKNGLSRTEALAAGYNIVSNRDELMQYRYSSTGRLMGLFGITHLPYELDGVGNLPHLSEMVLSALELLDDEPNGFFLMIEGGRIDHASHVNDIALSIFETVELSNSVEIALSWARGRTDTLIIVTADHETGGLELLESPPVGEVPRVAWSTTGHTARDVNYYAWGFGASEIESQIDNTAINSIVKTAGANFVSRTQVPCDFNADGRSDLVVARSLESSGEAQWHLYYSGLQVNQVVNFGRFATDMFSSGDFDGDGLSDIAASRVENDGSLATYIRQSHDLSIVARLWGLGSDLPVAADIDGDAVSDVSVFRQGDGSWWSLRSYLGPLYFSWGLAGDLPVPADFDGDGWEDLAIWRPSSGYWAVVHSSLGASKDESAIIWKQWGAAGDYIMPGDYDGDGKADLVVWRSTNGNWYICSSVHRYDCSIGQTFQFGLLGDIPIRADYDGDGILDLIVWRPSSGTWYIKQTSNAEELSIQWGLPGDEPLCAGITGH